MRMISGANKYKPSQVVWLIQFLKVTRYYSLENSIA